jgi:phenylpropionate dioxygenase-like ring-hydroxylating dioxygenase large terminal subunit
MPRNRHCRSFLSCSRPSKTREFNEEPVLLHGYWTYPAVEKYGLIWTRLRGEAEADPEKQQAIYGIPKMPHWDDPEFQQIVCPTIDIGGFAGRQVEGFLDVAHFGFVHTETFGDRANTRVPSYVPETNDVGFTVDYWSSVAKESRRIRMAAAFRGTSAVHRIDYGAFSG